MLQWYVANTRVVHCLAIGMGLPRLNRSMSFCFLSFTYKSTLRGLNTVEICNLMYQQSCKDSSIAWGEMTPIDIEERNIRLPHLIGGSTTVSIAEPPETEENCCRLGLRKYWLSEIDRNGPIFSSLSVATLVVSLMVFHLITGEFLQHANRYIYLPIRTHSFHGDIHS